MYLSHATWMTWVCVIASLGSFRCSWDVGSVDVVVRVDIDVSRLAVGRVLSPLCSLACTVVVFSMYIWV